MIDLSDGLSTDLGHLARESGTGAEVELIRLPRSGSVKQALHGGEDYELLFSIAPDRAAKVPRTLAGIPLTHIGRITKTTGISLLHPNDHREKLSPQGWEHLRRPADLEWGRQGTS